jgi:hypothetical protein
MFDRFEAAGSSVPPLQISDFPGFDDLADRHLYEFLGRMNVLTMLHLFIGPRAFTGDVAELRAAVAAWTTGIDFFTVALKAGHIPIAGSYSIASVTKDAIMRWEHAYKLKGTVAATQYLAGMDVTLREVENADKERRRGLRRKGVK